MLKKQGMQADEKIAIVSSGGGMRGVYTAGVLTALVQEYGFTNPHIVLASSGSAGSVAYYLSCQYDAGKIIWTTMLSTSRFISLLRFWRVLDVNYLVDEVFKVQFPLDIEKFHQTETKFFFPIADVETKEIRYVTNTDNIDIFEALRAAKAIPFFFRGKVTIEGRQYVDGAFYTNFMQTIADARELGATRIIAIDTRPKSKRKALMQSMNDKDVVLISNLNLPAGLITRDKNTLLESFELGYADALGHPGLRELFSV